MRRNRKEREEERSSEPDMVDGQMLWLLMQRLRRHARNRVSAATRRGRRAGQREMGWEADWAEGDRLGRGTWTRNVGSKNWKEVGRRAG